MSLKKISEFHNSKVVNFYFYFCAEIPWKRKCTRANSDPNSDNITETAVGYHLWGFRGTWIQEIEIYFRQGFTDHSYTVARLKLTAGAWMKKNEGRCVNPWFKDYQKGWKTGRLGESTTKEIVTFRLEKASKSWLWFPFREFDFHANSSKSSIESD